MRVIIFVEQTKTRLCPYLNQGVGGFLEERLGKRQLQGEYDMAGRKG